MAAQRYTTLQSHPYLSLALTAGRVNKFGVLGHVCTTGITEAQLLHCMGLIIMNLKKGMCGNKI